MIIRKADISLDALNFVVPKQGHEFEQLMHQAGLGIGIFINTVLGPDIYYFNSVNEFLDYEAKHGSELKPKKTYVGFLNPIRVQSRNLTSRGGRSKTLEVRIRDIDSTRTAVIDHRYVASTKQGRSTDPLRGCEQFHELVLHKGLYLGNSRISVQETLPYVVNLDMKR